MTAHHNNDPTRKVFEENTPLLAQQNPPEFNYHLLRNALNDFSKNHSQLNAEQYEKIHHKAQKSYQLESLVLQSAESEGVIVSSQQLDQALTELTSRYSDVDAFTTDLAANGLDQQSMRKALYRELMFDLIMQRVASHSSPVEEIDVQLFYELHRERFSTPEKRVARHILITINPDFKENTRDAALARIQQIENKISGHPNRLKNFARQFSECPSAMDGGALGEVQPGQLYPELDSMLFSMEQNQLSPIIESEMGFHLLLCEKIKPATQIPHARVRQRILDSLEQRNQRNCQKLWLADLQKGLS